MPHIDLEACTRRGIVVCAGSGSPYAPAELTLALILASTRVPRRGGGRAALGRLADDRRAGSCTAARSASSATGRSARSSHATARRSGCTSSPGAVPGRSSVPRRTAASRSPSSRSLFARSDVVSLHLKLTPETRGIVTAAAPRADEGRRAARQHCPRWLDRARCTRGRVGCWSAEERGDRRVRRRAGDR